MFLVVFEHAAYNTDDLVIQDLDFLDVFRWLGHLVPDMDAVKRRVMC